MTATVINFRVLPEGRWHLGTVIKRCYSLTDGQRIRLAADQQVPVDDEATAWKPSTDVAIRGHVYTSSPGGSSEQHASAEIGTMLSVVRATGDRSVEDIVAGVPRFSRPLPFERIPLVFDRCYGGFDRGAHDRLGDWRADHGVGLGADLDSVSRFTYPRNRRGSGFSIAIDLPRLIGSAVPNLDDPENPVVPERLIRASAEDWVAAPPPVALDWIEPLDFPRSAHWGVPPSVHGGRPPELDDGLVSEAELDSPQTFPPIPSPRALCGTRFGHRGIRLRGGEEVRLDNLHPTWRHIRTNLPSDAPIVRMQPPGCPWFDLEPQLDTVVLDLDAERLSMVWSAKLEVAGRYPDDELAQVVAEVRWP